MASRRASLCAAPTHFVVPAAATQSLLTGRILQAEGASGGSGSGGDSGSVGPDHHDASRAGPSQGPQSSPLMQLGQRLQQAAAEQQQKQQGPALPRASLPHLPGSDVADGTRTWRWYDAADEKEWQRMELARQYSDAGYAHLRHVPTSAKKMDRIVRVVSVAAVICAVSRSLPCTGFERPWPCASLTRQRQVAITSQGWRCGVACEQHLDASTRACRSAAWLWRRPNIS